MYTIRGKGSTDSYAGITRIRYEGVISARQLEGTP